MGGGGGCRNGNTHHTTARVALCAERAPRHRSVPGDERVSRNNSMDNQKPNEQSGDGIAARGGSSSAVAVSGALQRIKSSHFVVLESAARRMAEEGYLHAASDVREVIEALSGLTAESAKSDDEPPRVLRGARSSSARLVRLKDYICDYASEARRRNALARTSNDQITEFATRGAITALGDIAQEAARILSEAEPMKNDGIQRSVGGDS